MKKLRVLNHNYVWADGYLRLIPAAFQADDPWLVIGIGVMKHFRTHSEAVAWADKKARE